MAIRASAHLRQHNFALVISFYTRHVDKIPTDKLITRTERNKKMSQTNASSYKNNTYTYPSKDIKETMTTRKSRRLKADLQKASL